MITLVQKQHYPLHHRLETGIIQTSLNSYRSHNTVLEQCDPGGLRENNYSLWSFFVLLCFKDALRTVFLSIPSLNYLAQSIIRFLSNSAGIPTNEATRTIWGLPGPRVLIGNHWVDFRKSLGWLEQMIWSVSTWHREIISSLCPSTLPAGWGSRFPWQ